MNQENASEIRPPLGMPAATEAEVRTVVSAGRATLLHLTTIAAGISPSWLHTQSGEHQQRMLLKQPEDALYIAAQEYLAMRVIDAENAVAQFAPDILAAERALIDERAKNTVRNMAFRPPSPRDRRYRLVDVERFFSWAEDAGFPVPPKPADAAPVAHTPGLLYRGLAGNDASGGGVFGVGSADSLSGVSTATRRV